MGGYVLPIWVNVVLGIQLGFMNSSTTAMIAGNLMVCSVTQLGPWPNWEQFRTAQVPSQLTPRSVKLGAGPNWEQFRSAQVPSQLAPRSEELGAGPIWLKASPD